MRSDMAKILVGRPREGSRLKNWSCVTDRMCARDRDLEALPKRRGMAPRHGSRKRLNENLAPLRRFLQARCGRPWDAVYSELRSGLDVRSAIQKHIFEHLEDFVALSATWEGDVLYGLTGWGGRRALDGRYQRFYVCPKTRRLLRVPRPTPAQPEPAPHRHTVAGTIYVQHRGVWNAVRLERAWHRWGYYRADKYAADRRDVLLKARVTQANEAERARLYGGAALYAVERQPLNRKALKKLGLWRR